MPDIGSLLYSRPEEEKRIIRKIEKCFYKKNSCRAAIVFNEIIIIIYTFIHIPWLFPPIKRVASIKKRKRSLTLFPQVMNEGPGRDQAVLLEQHSPPSPSSTSFIASNTKLPVAPTKRLP